MSTFTASRSGHEQAAFAQARREDAAMGCGPAVEYALEEDLPPAGPGT